MNRIFDPRLTEDEGRRTALFVFRPPAPIQKKRSACVLSFELVYALNAQRLTPLPYGIEEILENDRRGDLVDPGLALLGLQAQIEHHPLGRDGG